MTWYRVTVRYACYAICVSDDLISDAAPIARWAIGRHIVFFKDWVQRKGGTVEEMK